MAFILAPNFDLTMPLLAEMAHGQLLDVVRQATQPQSYICGPKTSSPPIVATVAWTSSHGIRWLRRT